MNQHVLALQIVLLILQSLQVLFLWIHDWVPLGSLNDVKAVRRQDSRDRLIVVTLIQSVPFTIILALCIIDFNRPYPGWLITSLWIAYVTLMAGQIRAWWLPYLVLDEPARAKRYAAMFGRTHSFLPVRNGLVPNTAHIFLHICTAATLIVLWLV